MVLTKHSVYDMLSGIHVRLFDPCILITVYCMTIPLEHLVT